MKTVIEGVLSNRTIDACDEAEVHFRDCATQITTGERRGQSHINVYYNAHRIPLAIAKSFRVRSALTLQPVLLVTPQEASTSSPDSSADEVLAGSISALGPNMAVRRTGHRLMDGGWFLSTLLVDGPLSIRPMRLSGWASGDTSHNPNYVMPEYTPAQAQHESDGMSVFEGLTLDDFRAAATQALVICGVTAPITQAI